MGIKLPSGQSEDFFKFTMHKYLQRKLYDTITSRNGVLTVLFSVALVISSAFYFGEVSNKYFSDGMVYVWYSIPSIPVP